MVDVDLFEEWKEPLPSFTRADRHTTDSSQVRHCRTNVVREVARVPTVSDADCTTRRRLSARCPLLGRVELIEAKHPELAGNHPGESMHGMAHPVLVRHNGDPLER